MRGATLAIAMKHTLCSSCDARLNVGSHFCARCGEPTAEASVEERRQHDLEKWHAYHAVPSAPSTSHATTVRERAPKAPATPRASDAAKPASNDPFAYRACARCGRADWIIRTGKDEVGAWRYWCVRCSRAFTTDVRLRHAIKPFAVSAAILLALTLFTIVH